MTEKLVVLCAAAVVAGLVVSRLLRIRCDGAGIRAFRRSSKRSRREGGDARRVRRDDERAVSHWPPQERFPMASTVQSSDRPRGPGCGDPEAVCDSIRSWRYARDLPRFSPIVEEGTGDEANRRIAPSFEVVESDNTASDMLLAAAGGAAT